MKIGLSGLVLLGSMLGASQGGKSKSHPPEGEPSDLEATPTAPAFNGSTKRSESTTIP